ncbi:MAG: GNAT family N-acetyltransferase [Armatimonadota bacterium]
METETSPLLTIRRATLADLDLLLAWRKSMVLDIGAADEATVDAALPHFAAWTREQLPRTDRCAAFIGSLDDNPVACAMAMIYDWYPGISDTATRRGYLFSVYTHPTCRRRGFAGQVVQACTDWLRQQGVRTISLHTSAQGQSVYARFGFFQPGMPEMVMRLDTESNT